MEYTFVTNLERFIAIDRPLMHDCKISLSYTEQSRTNFYRQ